MTIDLQQLMSRRRAAMTPAQKARSMKRTLWLASDTASRTLFASVYGLDGGVTPFTLSGKRYGINWERAMAVGDTPLKWVITCYAICRDRSGNDYLPAPMTIELSAPVKQDAINKALSQAHFDWVKECVNKQHLMTLAWIATTAMEPSEGTAMRIFTELGAWDAFDIVQPTDDGGYLTVRKGE
jgi:hypothetical protein